MYWFLAQQFIISLVLFLENPICLFEMYIGYVYLDEITIKIHIRGVKFILNSTSGNIILMNVLSNYFIYVIYIRGICYIITFITC